MFITSVFSKKNRALLSELVRTDFKLRYQGSALGYAWSLLRPLLIFIILYLVFVKMLRIGSAIPHFPVYLLLGIVIWNFFLEMTMQSLGSIVGRGELIRKIRIPRWIIVLSSSISALINLFLNLLVVLVFLIINKVDLLETTLWLPLILFEVYVFALGLSLFLSAAFVKYRTFQKLIMLNPMAQAIQDARYSSITHQTQTIYHLFDGGWYQFIPFIIVLATFFIGFTYFRSQSKYFAENI
jgi:ABC-2 type transport system permease protein